MGDDALVEALVAQLRTNLPARLSEAGLPQLKEVLNYDPPSLAPTRCPRVYVDIALDQRAASAGRGSTLGRYSHRPTILVGVQIAEEKPALAVRTLRQLVGVVRQCVEADQTAGGTALWVTWQRTEYSPNMGREETKLNKEAVLIFDLNHRSPVVPE